MRGIFQEKTLQRVLSMPVLLTIYMESVDGIHILIVSYSIMCPIPLRRLLPETFCRGDILLGDVLLQRDVLLRRRYVEETFC